nr:hypothetical protein [Candidatus Sigynarchaeota archaeon]
MEPSTPKNEGIIRYTKNNAKDQEFSTKKINPGAFEDDDEKEESGNKGIAFVPANNLAYVLVTFFIFAAIDLIMFVSMPIVFLLFPLVVHGAFLPVLLYIIYKQRRGEYPPTTTLTFIQITITYMVIYMITQVIVATITGDFLTIGIYLMIGIMLVSSWARILGQYKAIFGAK